jgi:hypothetical protein
MHLFAKIISIVCHYIFLGPIIYILLLINAPLSSKMQISYTVLTAVLLMLVPFIIVFDYLRAGKIDDIDITKRSQRGAVTMLLDLSFLMYFLISLFLPIPHVYKLNAAFGVIFGIFFTRITYDWKISYHLGVVGWLAGVLVQIYGWKIHIILIILTVAFITAWSRIYLKKHTPMQAFVGFVVAFLIYYSLRLIY